MECYDCGYYDPEDGCSAPYPFACDFVEKRENDKMTIDEIQSALKFDMDMMLFDSNTGETYPKESLKTGNKMNYILYCADEQAIELLDELKIYRKVIENCKNNSFTVNSNEFSKIVNEWIEKGEKLDD